MVALGTAFDAILHPQSIVAVGASSDPLRLAGRPLRYLVEHGFRGHLCAVNPRHDKLYGVKSYPAIEDVPEATDLALVTLPAHRLVEAVSACGERGVKACVIYSAIPDDERQAVDAGLLEARDKTGIRILGPNCNGVFNVSDRVAMSLSSALMERASYQPGPIALIGQSGGALSSVYSQGVGHGVRFAYYVATGNELDLTLEDGMAFFLEQPRVDVIAAFVESFRNPVKLIAVAEHARASGKALVVLRVGRSERAGEIAFSHTGALAGPAEHEEAFLRAAGVTVVRDLRDMWSVSSLLMVRGALRTRRLAVVTTSGGVAAFVADLAADEGVELADLAPETRASLASCLGVTEVTNPVDVTGAVVDDPSLAANALSLLDADAEVGATLLVLSRTGRDEALAHALDDAGQTLTMPLFLLWLSDLEEGTAFDVFRSKGTPTFSSCREALRAFRVAACAGPPADLGTWTVSLPGSPIPRSRGRMVDESTVKCWLRELGVRTPRGHIADSPDAVVDMADKTGYPVVVKLLDQRVAHRAALGLVRVNLADRTAVADAIRDLTARAVKAGLDAAPRFLVEEYVAAQGVEWIVGVKNDLRFGPVVLFGFGGVAAEAVGDIALAPAPLTDAAADQLLRRTRVFNYWAGKMSVEQCIALRSVVVAVGALADRLRTELVELDLNPVVVTSAGDAVVLDGLGILRDSDADDEL